MVTLTHPTLDPTFVQEAMHPGINRRSPFSCTVVSVTVMYIFLALNLNKQQNRLTADFKH